MRALERFDGMPELPAMRLFDESLYKTACKRIIPFTLVILFFCAGSSFGGTVAVFPLLDLTRDANGINFTITESVRQKAIENGFEVIPENAVMDFMVRNRIRTLGTLSSYELTQLRKELGAEYAMLGTVCQLEDQPTAKISLSLKLIRTSDEEIIWSTINDLHKDDLISLLGLTDVETTKDLYQEYFSTVFAGMPQLADEEPSVKPFVNLLFVDMQPLYVKPGEKIELVARFYSTVAKDNLPSFYLEIDGKKHEVEVDEDAHFLKSSFLAQERSGSYKVSLVAAFPSGERQILNLSEYTVDALPPELSIQLHGIERDGEVNFSRELLILPRLTVPERLSMWEVVVYDTVGDAIVTQAGDGQIPEKIFWNGRDNNQELVPDGRYKIVFTVWDRAKNKSTVEQSAVHRHNSPEVYFYVTRNQDSVTLEFENQIDYPLMYWFAKVYKQNGTLVISQTGEQLPPSMEFKVEGMTETENLELIFFARDIYGNNKYSSVPDFLNLGKKELREDVVPESQWLESF